MADQTRGCAYACEVEAAPRAGNPTREFSRPGIHTPPARVRCGAGVRRYCRVATTDVAERMIAEAAPKRAARDVFLYFDNDAKVRAPFDAKALISRVDKLLKG